MAPFLRPSSPVWMGLYLFKLESALHSGLGAQVAEVAGEQVGVGVLDGVARDADDDDVAAVEDKLLEEGVAQLLLNPLGAAPALLVRRESPWRQRLLCKKKLWR